MKNYFKKLLQGLRTNDVPHAEIVKYRIDLISEIKRQGGDDSDIGLISEELIINSIKNQNTPEEVAYAILQ